MGYETVALTYQPATLREKGLVDLGDIQYKTKRYGRWLVSDSNAQTRGQRFGL